LNEIEWVNKNGVSVYVHQNGCEPKGYIEKETVSLKNKASHFFEWPKMENFETKGLQMVKDFASKLE